MLRDLPRFRHPLDPLGQYPRLAAAAGMVGVAVLVPVLKIWNGAAGPLGQSIPLFFLVPVLLASALGGRGAGVVVSCAAIITWDWFFIPPLYRITINSVRDLLALIVFIAVALLVGQLSTAARRRADEAVRRAHSSDALYDLSMALIAHRELSEVLPALTQRLYTAFDLEACAVLLPDAQGHWHTAAQAGKLPRDLRIEESRSLAATADRVQLRGEQCRLGHLQHEPGRSDRVRLPRAGTERARLLPLKIGTRPVGVLEVVPRASEKPDEEREHLLTTFANGAALALEQARLAEEERAAALARESDRLKSALLSSVSHDLRTPLAGIKAAASSLLQRDIEWSEEDRQSFIADIDAEADRLTRLVSNLLDLSRIEAGVLKPAKEWEDAGELLERVLSRLKPRLGPHILKKEISVPLPPLRLDALQIEQVLTNLLENAVKYSPPDTTIVVCAHSAEFQDHRPALLIAVSDQGVGIPHADLERVFERFYRVQDQTHRVGGAGMGLAIVKGLVDAHGGQVTVTSTPGMGSTFTVLLPIEDVAPAGRSATAAGKGISP